jgi:hypothetical protein
MINYHVMADIAIYPWEARHDLISEQRGYELPDGALEFTSRIMVRTRSTMDPFAPRTLELISKLNLRVYDQPTLVAIKDSQTILSAFAPRQSGVIEGITQVFIVIMPPGTYVWPYKEHPKLRSEL